MSGLRILFLVAALTSSAPAATANDVTVSVENPNSYLPVKVEWKVGNESGEIVGTGKIPAGATTLIIRPHHKGAWYQWGEWVVNGELVNSGLNNIRRDTVKNDTIRVLALQPAPSWCAATLRVKGELVLVWVTANEGIPKWAALGEKKIATDLAAAFCKERKEKGKWGSFEANGVRLYVSSSTGDDVPKALLELKEADVAQQVTEALTIIRRQRRPIGASVEELLMNARRID